MWASSLTRTFLLTALSSATRTLRASLLRPPRLRLEALPAAAACSDSPESLPASDRPAVAATSVGAMERGTSATDLSGKLLQTPLEGGLKQEEAAPQQSLASLEALLGAGTPTTASSEVLPRSSCACTAQARLHWHACQAAAAPPPGLASSLEVLLLQGSWSQQSIAATGSSEV